MSNAANTESTMSPATVPAADTPWTWTPSDEAMAVRLFLVEGLSASDVALALGGGITRSAVLAKVRRLGFRKRRGHTSASTGPLPISRLALVAGASPPRVERRLPPQRPPIPLPPLCAIPPTGSPVTLADLADTACRWPIDDPGPGRMHHALFCAGPAEGDVYCPAHRALATSGRIP